MRGLVDATGRAISLGEKLGSGGEGDVFAVIGQPQVVAKLYHRPISREHQAKLLAMVNSRNTAILPCTAWPTATLHQKIGCPVVGFLMPKVSGFEAIHKLYSPAHRKHMFPRVDWAFLVHVARNTAAAFAAVHAAGHVISDVNQGNLVVAANGKVCLIDCDSFQVANGNDVFLCEVGVPHFTPPELQSLSSFRGVHRTQNHDQFGLAVICFHLLFMGRHPFAGVYRGPGDMPIEKAIAGYRFAFSANGTRQGMLPPPNSVSLATVPQQVAALFELAFNEQGVKRGRPSASHWVGMLDYLRNNLRSCSTEAAHKFFGGLSSCPWCQLEQASGVVFFIASSVPVVGTAMLNLEAVWRQIMAVDAPTPPALPSPSAMHAKPRPLPPSSDSLMGVVKWVFGALFGESEEKKKRRLALAAAAKRWQEIKQQWMSETGDARFQHRLTELHALRDDYKRVDAEYTAALQALQNTVRERQLHRFLDSFIIEEQDVPQIGPSRSNTLRSFSIETAADIDANAILGIPGFGPSLTAALMDWRRDLERKFVFNPSKGIDQADVSALDHRFRQRRQNLEGKLLAGAESLNALRAEAFARARALKPIVDNAARCLAQAQADFSIA